MADTRYTPQGKKKKPKIVWQRFITFLLCVGMVIAFCTFGLKYMMTGRVVQAEAAPTDAAPKQTVSATPLETPAPANVATISGTETIEATPEATPFATVLTEDSENGKWLYEDEAVRIDINREQPLNMVVATVAVITPKTDVPVIRTAFADGAYGANIRARTRDIAASVSAVFAINGDYCGFRSDGIIVRDGVLYRDHATRDALCLFADGSLRVMTESNMNAQDMIDNQGLCDTWSFGPLLVSGGNVAETFHTDVKGKNPRTALGQRADGSYVAVVVDGRLSGYSEGMTIQELAQYMKDLGCVEAYNLDGGMTSCMYFNGSVISTPCGTANKERSLSDIIYIGGAEA